MEKKQINCNYCNKKIDFPIEKIGIIGENIYCENCFYDSHCYDYCECNCENDCSNNCKNNNKGVIC